MRCTWWRSRELVGVMSRTNQLLVGRNRAFALSTTWAPGLARTCHITSQQAPSRSHVARVCAHSHTCSALFAASRAWLAVNRTRPLLRRQRGVAVAMSSWAGSASGGSLTTRPPSTGPDWFDADVTRVTPSGDGRLVVMMVGVGETANLLRPALASCEASQKPCSTRTISKTGGSFDGWALIE